jgi:hypothetical protein
MRPLLNLKLDSTLLYLSILFFAGPSLWVLAGQEPTETAKPSPVGANGASGLNVTIRADKSEYQLSDKISLLVLLENRTKSPIYLFSDLEWGESASLSLWPRNAVSGVELPMNFVFDEITPPPKSQDDFVKLLPGHVFGVVLTCPLNRINIREKGKYEFVVQYHSPIPSNLGYGLPIWGREKGVIPSNHVIISVGD